MPRFVRRLLLLPLPVLGLAYAALWFAIGLFPTPPSDLDLFFWPSAQVALMGHPFLVYTHTLTLYAVNGPQTYLNDNGPLSLLPLVLVGFLLRALGHPNSLPLLHALTYACFSIFSLLMAREAVLAIERLRHSVLPREARTATFAFLLLAPPIFQSLAGYGHIEQPLEVWLLLLSLRLLAKSSFMSAGLLLGLAALTRSTAALFAIPMIVFALPRTPVAAFRLATAMLATGLLVLLPFFLADFSSTASSLFTHRSTLPIYTGSIWVLFRSSPLASLGQHFDFLFICSLALALNLLVATRRGGLTPLRLIAALALTSASFLLLTKTLWPYYFFELFVLTTVFSFSSPGPLLHSLLPPLYACALGLLAEVGSTPFQHDSIISLEGVAMFVLLLAFIAWLVHAAIHAKAGREVSTEPEQGRRSAPPRVSAIERLLLPRLRRPV